MSLVRPSPEPTKARVIALKERMEQCRKLLTYLREEGWMELSRWLEGEIEAKKDALCRQNLPIGETTALRAEVWTLRAVLGLPDKTLKEMEAIGAEARHLQDKLEKWHTRRYPDVEQSLDEARSLAATQKVGGP